MDKQAEMDWYVKVLVGNAQTRYPLAHALHQGHATIRSVWRSLHTGSSPAIRAKNTGIGRYFT